MHPSASRATTMSGRARASRSRARHGRSSPAVDGGSAPRGRGESPPPVADVTARGTSPASTIGVASATPAPARASPRRSVARQSTEASVASPSQCGPPIVDGGQSPARLGPSPAKNPGFSVEPVGIPTSKPPRKIKNVDESKWEEGYDSDGEIGPFLDAVADHGGGSARRR